MPKIKAALFLSLLLAVSTVLIPGCGKNESGSGKLREIIDESNEMMQRVKTFELDFDSKVDAPVLSDEEEDLSMTVSADISDKNNLKYHLRFTGAGTSTEAYAIDGYVYAFVPDKGWLKSPADEVKGVMDVFQLSPSELDKLTDNAQELEMRSDTENSYVISFKVGPKFFEEAILNRQLAEELDPGIKDIIGEMARRTNMKAVMTIDKATMRVTEVDLGMDVKDLELVGDIDMDIEAVFSKYDEPVEIALPPEAAGARDAAPEEIKEILKQLPI